MLVFDKTIASIFNPNRFSFRENNKEAQ